MRGRKVTLVKAGPPLSCEQAEACVRVCEPHSLMREGSDAMDNCNRACVIPISMFVAFWRPEQSTCMSTDMQRVLGFCELYSGFGEG